MGTVRYTTMNGQIVAEKRDGTRRLYSSDALGSTTALYEGTTKTDSFTYWPYGETRTRTGTTPTKYKSNGTLGCREQADGGIYMRARIVDPEDGRWLTVDPLWPREAAYGYASQRPSLFVDPTGMMPNIKCRLLFWCLPLRQMCFLCLEQYIDGKWVPVECFKAGSGGHGRPIPKGCWCLTKRWVDMSAESPAWGQGKVCMPLRPCPEEESAMRSDNPGRQFHPGSFCLHGGADVNQYESNGCITTTDKEIAHLKRHLGRCSNYPSDCFELRVP